MEQAKSLTEQQDANSVSSFSSTKRGQAPDNGSQQSGRELHRAPSLGFDAFYKRFMRPSSTNNAIGSCTVQPSPSHASHNLPSPSGIPCAHTSQPHSIRHIASDQDNCPGRSTMNPLTTKIWHSDNSEHFASLMDELRIRSTTGSLESRLNTIDELTNTIRSHQITDQKFSYILDVTKELLDEAQPNEVRHRVWRLYTQLVRGKAESVGHLRYLLFDLILIHCGRSEDIPRRIDLLIALTECGRTLHYYENDMADFMVSFLSNLIEKRTNINLKVKKLSWDVQKNFLKFMTDLVKYNAAHISSEKSQALCIMIQYTCQLAFESTIIEELEKIFDFLNVVLSYGHLPSDSLSQFVIVVCIGINNPNLFSTCYQIMRNLLGTHLGFACLNTLLHIIEDQTNYTEHVLIRGAVYFLVHSMWCELYNERVTLSPNTVLPAFKNLLENDQIATPTISLEIASGILCFLQSAIPTSSSHKQVSHGCRPSQPFTGATVCSEELSEVPTIVFEWTWELVLSVCHELINGIVNSRTQVTPKDLLSVIQLLIENLNLLIQTVLSLTDSTRNENLQMTHNEFVSLTLLGSNEAFIQKIFIVLELGIVYLSENSTFCLIANRLNYISNNLRIIPNGCYEELSHLMEVFFSKSNLSMRICSQFFIELQKFIDNNSTLIDSDQFWAKVASKHYTNLEESNRSFEIHGIVFLQDLIKKLNLPRHLEEIAMKFKKMAYFYMRKLFYRKHSVSHSGNRNNMQIIHQNSAPNHMENNDSFNDLVYVVNGLVSIFLEKIDHSDCHAVAVTTFQDVIEFFIEFLSVVKASDPEFYHNANSNRIRTVCRIKCIVIRMILSLRSNALGQIGVVENALPQGFAFSSSPSPFSHSQSSDEKIKYSSYLLTEPDPPLPAARDGNVNLLDSHLQNFSSNALFLILGLIQTETDWTVLETIFDKLAKMLKNKSFILSIILDHSSLKGIFPDVRFTELSFPDQLVCVLEKFIESLPTHLGDIQSCDKTRAECLEVVFKSISELVNLNYSLQPSSQALLIKCLKAGLVQFSAKIPSIRQCIISLTICSMEMQTTMNKYLKDIIITLSKISSNKTLAVPKLEFFSNIILFPDLYYTFTVKQYLSIFSIASQYINPFFHEFTVVLALRVISMWFLKCPSPFRIQLMKFLTKQLNTNILKEMEPQISQRLNSISISSEHRSRLESRLSVTSSPPPPPTTPVNVFSSQFSFSFHSSNSNLDSHHSSLHPLSSSGSAFNVPISSSSNSPLADGLILDPNNKELSKMELVEVCMDFFSTSVFNTTSPLPLKPSMIDKLLNRQKAQLWIIGHKIIQITTTACSSRAFKNGLCSKCYHICHMNPKDPEIDSQTSSRGGSQTNIFSDRGCFSNQLSYEQINQSNSVIASNRRRHRSEANHTMAAKNATPFSTDDYFMKRNQGDRNAASTAPTTAPSNNIASDPDLINGTVDTRFCRCWCQNWAEILVRRSTGNTRWVMRVENVLGDFPYWTYSKEADDLADIFSHADPEVNLALKLQKEAEEEPDSTIELLGTSSSSNVGQSTDAPAALKSPAEKTPLLHSVSTHESTSPRQRVSVPVARASSFGNRRPMIQSNMLEQQTSPRKMPELNVLSQAKHEVLERWNRKLEKEYSVDQDEPPVTVMGESSHRICDESLSPAPSNASSDNTVISSDRNYRDRSSTISVMTPVQKSASSTGVIGGSSQTIFEGSKPTVRPSISSGALSPQAIFLQLYYNSTFKDVQDLSNLDKPIMLDSMKNEALVRSINCLDRVTPYETHKIGILYVGPGQVNNKSEILSNQMGSLRYTSFLQKLGHTINIADVDPNVCFLGGLDKKNDGPYAISWGDHLVQAIFHVGTFMPMLNKADRRCQNKMLHIGNDFISIVYNNSGEKFDIATIKGDGQFIQAMVIITPLELGINSVHICGNKELVDFIGHVEPQIISDSALSVYVRQLALHANLAAMVNNKSKNLKSYNISNWISRLHCIKRVRARATENLPLFNPELCHYIRGAPSLSTPHPMASPSPHSRSARLGNGTASQSSREDADSVISSSLASPNNPGSAGTTSSGAFDYPTETRLAFPDFTEFTKDLY